MFELLVMYCLPTERSEHCVIEQENQRYQGQTDSSHVKPHDLDALWGGVFCDFVFFDILPKF